MDLLISNYKGYNVFLHESSINCDNLKNLYFYINKHKIHHNYISNNDSVKSYIHFVYDLNSAHMIFLKTHNIFKNKGFASFLLKLSINYLKEKKVKKIELDDMSNHSRSPNNIYINFGFKYINPYPEPEMELKLN